MAVAYLPDAVVSGKAHDEAVDGFCKSGIKVAEQRVQEGKYNEAEAICEEMLGDQYDPNCQAAQKLLASLREPGQFNRTMGPKFIAKVEEVRKLLIDADGYYNSGRYDLAFKKYEQVLESRSLQHGRAPRGRENQQSRKTHYGEEAYNETRSRAMWQVQKGWEEPVRKYGTNRSGRRRRVCKEATGTARISNKLNTIIIPKIEFRDASIREAIDFLRQQAAANDPATDGRKGVDIVLRMNAIGASRRTGRGCSRGAARCARAGRGSRADGGAVVNPAPVAVPAAPTHHRRRTRASRSHSIKFRSAKRCVTSRARPA